MSKPYGLNNGGYPELIGEKASGFLFDGVRELLGDLIDIVV